MRAIEYRQVDVFATSPLAGNGLAVVITEHALAGSLMQGLTRELRQFETIFLTPLPGPGKFAARVFTMEEELPFAGHPSIGAAAVLHERAGGNRRHFKLVLPAGEVALRSQAADQTYIVSMNQGSVDFGRVIPSRQNLRWLRRFGLEAHHSDPCMPIAVASTGLPYLVVPVTSEGLDRARIVSNGLEQQLAAVGAKFAYLLDVANREGRSWDNLGTVEDVATGSAAGPVAGLLARYGRADVGERILLRQGRFAGRPSEMTVAISGTGEGICGDAVVTGSVVMVARGQLDPHVTG